MPSGQNGDKPFHSVSQNQISAAAALAGLQTQISAIAAFVHGSFASDEVDSFNPAATSVQNATGHHSVFSHPLSFILSLLFHPHPLFLSLHLLLFLQRLLPTKTTATCSSGGESLALRRSKRTTKHSGFRPGTAKQSTWPRRRNSG